MKNGKNEMINLPKKLKIGGREYSVLYPYRFKERVDRVGHSNHSRQEIAIGNDDGNGNEVHRNQVESVFIHELLHCIDYVYNNGTLKEEVINRIGEGLYQVLKDNDIVQWKTKKKQQEN